MFHYISAFETISRIIVYNMRMLFVLCKSDIIHQNALELIHSEDRNMFKSQLAPLTSDRTTGATSGTIYSIGSSYHIVSFLLHLKQLTITILQQFLDYVYTQSSAALQLLQSKTRRRRDLALQQLSERSAFAVL